MTHVVAFAPARYVTVTGERVRQDPSGAPILLADYDALSAAESAECELAMHRLVQAGFATSHIQRRLDRLDADMAKRKTGNPWTEEQYREAGIETLHLRLGPDDHAALDELAAEWGYEGRGARGAAVKRAIAEAHARVVPRARRTLLVEQAPDSAPDSAPDGSAVRTREPLNTRSGGRKSDKSKP